MVIIYTESKYPEITALVTLRKYRILQKFRNRIRGVFNFHPAISINRIDAHPAVTRTYKMLRYHTDRPRTLADPSCKEVIVRPELSLFIIPHVDSGMTDKCRYCQSRKTRIKNPAAKLR